MTSKFAPVLQARGLSKAFGGLRVTREVDLDLLPGSRVGLIGPNGAGKSTLVNLLTGATSLDAGTILMGGVDITKRRREERVKHGLVRTHQISTLIGGYTALENVAVAIAEREGIAWRMFGFGRRWRGCLQEAANYLQELGLSALAEQVANQMAYGAQRLLEIAVALALRPRVLLLDEPAAGVPASETRLIEDAFGRLPHDIAILIIDHDIDLVFRFANEVTVLAEGSVLMRGTPLEVAGNPTVKAVYLGRQST